MFFLDGDATDGLYAQIRDGADAPDRTAREVLESLWSEFEPYAPPDFRHAARNDLIAYFWEMYLACTLLRRGKPLLPRTAAASSQAGPDLRLDRTPPIWFEAVAPTVGTGADAVPASRPSALAEVAESEIMLRYTQGVVEKREARESYVNSSVIASTDPYVVAVSAGRFLGAIVESDLPSIMRSTLGFGPLEPVKLPDGSTVFSFDSKLEKKSGNAVATDLFFRPEFAGVSAALWSPANPYSLPEVFGSEFVWVFNRDAANPVRPECFPFGRSYWLRDSSLQIRDWESGSGRRPTRRCS